jgi:SAM-dependent methyltransferase
LIEPVSHLSDRAPAAFDARGYWEDRLTRHPGLAGVGYLRLGARYNAWLYRIRSEVFRRLTAEWHLSGRPIRVVDIGSGTGHYLHEWLLAGARAVVGTDLTDVAVHRLRAEFPGLTIHQLDIGGVGSVAGLGRYDVVSAFDVLFHITDDEAYKRALQNAYALCRPGGYFIFSELFLRHGRAATTHMVSRSREEIVRLLRCAGFVPLARRPMFVLMNYPADTTARLAQLAWTALVGPSVVSDRLGGFIGRALFALERRLVQWVEESPTTEIMICRRPAPVLGKRNSAHR